MLRIIDLTLPLENGQRGVSIEPARRIETDGWNATTLHLYSHCGTHMDAPKHFGVTDQTIDLIRLEQCMGPAWVADLSGIEPRALIQVDDLGPVRDNLRAGDGLLLRTGWSQRADNPSYRNALPRVSLELAEWCVAKGVRTLGVEPPSVADVNNLDELTAVHGALLGGGVIVVEGLTNLDKVQKDKVTFMAFPLKVAMGDGSPVRAFAIED
ncbi:MAG: cyclase family protein [Planctomycetota bacterium]|jgi:kynurenine formamidase